MGLKFIDVFTDMTGENLDGSQSEISKLSKKSGAKFMIEMIKRNKENENPTGKAKNNDATREEKLLKVLDESYEKFRKTKNAKEIPHLISLLYALGEERGVSKEKIDSLLKFE